MAAQAMPWPGIVALSGGGDSMALTLLLADWAREGGRVPPVAAIVDHALRPESDKEARNAARMVRAKGVEAKILTRKGAAPVAGIETAAREARYALIGAYAAKKGISAVYVAHTEDDQAETFLLRLARGSGVDGLSAMRPLAPYPAAGFDTLRVARPLLRFSRAKLRDFLVECGQDWIEDPMNDDSRFARVLVRQSWPALERLGLGRHRLAETAERLGLARRALEAAADDLSARAVQRRGENMYLDAHILAAAPAEVGLRVLAGALMAVSGQPYRPRFERLQRVYRALCDDTLGGGRTLHGCRIAPARAEGKGVLRLCKEPPRRRGARGNS
jgi:tRNA(Ile)-lysidine synthase